MKKRILHLPYRKIRAINDPAVVSFIKGIFKNHPSLYESLNDKNIHINFLNEYKKWIKSTKVNRLKNLDKFKFACFSNGSSQAFDYFYAKYKDRRFRALRGEYVYHHLSWRNHFPSWSYIDDLNIKENDAVIISLPFSDSGSKHPKMEELIKICDKKNIPVLVDCCYFSMCKGINFDFNHKSIKAISFSLSKAFPVSRLRIGMRLTRTDDDDPLFFLNKLGLVNRNSAFIGLKILKKFKFDYIYNKYEKFQKYYCTKMELTQSNIVSIGIGGKKWIKYNRGGSRNRLCLSSLYEKKKKFNF
tara:strand:+ start:231 stop:1133 length:903 start_codon:yes stop_codon:yes gene_type:complete